MTWELLAIVAFMFACLFAMPLLMLLVSAQHVMKKRRLSTRGFEVKPITGRMPVLTEKPLSPGAIPAASAPAGLFVQYGCGLCAPQGWLNFDVSPLLRLQRLPVVGRFVPDGPFGRFPSNVQVGDIIKGLPVTPQSVDVAYCSHTLEHLSFSDFRLALRNTYAMLKPGGLFRFVLPDLRTLALDYIESKDDDASVRFVGALLMAEQSRARGLRAILREVIGNTRHRWMWDERSLAMELQAAGFIDVRRAAKGDSGIAQLDAVEDADRWDRHAVGMQAKKPS